MTPARSRKKDPARDEIEALTQTQGDALEAEIHSLRSQARRVAEMAREVDSLKEAILALNALGTAFNRLARLLESQKKLSGGRSEFDKALEEVLEKINRDDEEKRQALRREAVSKDKKTGKRKTSSEARARKQKNQDEAAKSNPKRASNEKGTDYAKQC